MIYNDTGKNAGKMPVRTRQLEPSASSEETIEVSVDRLIEAAADFNMEYTW
ncbi:hypothetical protein [Salibacterium aidingense]|uniref:hypothetical protein n=1 Tax=Salibacterium aidingense TaxID=384933 RepID=UPI003BE739BD